MNIFPGVTSFAVNMSSFTCARLVKLWRCARFDMKFSFVFAMAMKFYHICQVVMVLIIMLLM